MTSKLRGLLVGGIAAVIAGVGVFVYAPAPGTTQAELLDAGITQDFTPRRLACMVLWDGGYVEKRPLVAVSNYVLDGGRRDTIWQRAAIKYREQLADADKNCRDLGATTWGAVAAEFNGSTTAEHAGSCACWQPDAGDCRQSDGGTQVRDGHNEFAPNDWSGAGCVAKPCGEVFGARNWPERCAR